MLELSKTLYDKPYCHSNIPKVKCLIMLWLDNHVGETIEIKEQKNKVLPIIIQGNETARFGLSVQEKGPLVFEAFNFVNQKVQYLLNDKKSVDIPVQNTINNLRHVVISYDQSGITNQVENDPKLEHKPGKVKPLTVKPTNTTQQISVTLFIENKLNIEVKLFDLIGSMEPVKIDPYSKLQVTFKVNHGWPLKLKAETTENNKVSVNGQNMFPVNMKASKKNKYNIALTIPSTTVTQNNAISSDSQNTILLNVNNTLAKPIVVMETINNLQPILIPPKTVCKIGFLLNGTDFLILTAIEIDKDHKGVKLNGHDNLAVQIKMNPLDFNLINVTGDDVDVNYSPVNETNTFTGLDTENNGAGNYGGIIQGNKGIETLDKELEKEINKTSHIRLVENQEKDSVKIAEGITLEGNKTDIEISLHNENLDKEELKDVTNISAIRTKSLYPGENMTGSGNITKNSKTEVGVSGLSAGSGMHYVRGNGNYSSGGNTTDTNSTEITSAPEKEGESEGGGEVFTEPQIQNMNPEKAIPGTDKHDNESLEKNLSELAHKGQSINLGDFTNADKAKQMVEAAHVPADAKNEHAIELNETKVKQKLLESPRTTTQIANKGAVSMDTYNNDTLADEESVTLGNTNTTENSKKVGELGTSNSTEFYLNETETEVNNTETATQQTIMVATNISEANFTKIKNEPLNAEKVGELGTSNLTEIYLNGTGIKNTETVTQQTTMVATNISEANFTKIKSEPLNAEKEGELSTSNSTEIYLNGTEVNNTETATQQTSMVATNITEANFTKINELLNAEKVGELGTSNSTEIYLNGTEVNNTETATQQTTMVATNITEANFTKIKNEPLNKQKLENLANTFEKNNATSNLTNTNNTIQVTCFHQGNITLNENYTVVAQVNSSKENTIAENLILENETMGNLNETSTNAIIANETKEPIESGNSTVIPDVNRTISHSNFTKVDRNLSNTDANTTNFGETLKAINNNLTTENATTVNSTQNITKNDGTANTTQNISKSEKNQTNFEIPNRNNSNMNESSKKLGGNVTKINPNISTVDGNITKVEDELETINKISNENTTKLPLPTSTNTNTSNNDTDKNVTSNLQKDISSVNVTGLSSSDNATKNTTDIPTLDIMQNINGTAGNMANDDGTKLANKLLPTPTEPSETIDLGAQQTTAGFDSEEIVNAQELNRNEIQEFACKFL